MVQIKLGRIKGADGERGEKGDTGAQGEQGIQGVQGVSGVTPTFAIGTVQTVDANSDANVTVSGTAPNYVLNFDIPRGISGGGDMKSSEYNPGRQAYDIKAYIDENIAIRPSGGTFTGAVKLRSNAPQTDDEAVPKSYSDGQKADVINKINDFIDELNESEATAKREPDGSVIFSDTYTCSLQKVPSITNSGTGYKFESDSIKIGVAIPNTNPVEYKKRYYLKIDNVAMSNKPTWRGQDHTDYSGSLVIETGGQEYTISSTSSSRIKIETPCDIKIKKEERYPHDSTCTANGLMTVSFNVSFEDKIEFEKIGDGNGNS